MDETVKERDLSDLLWVFGCESSTVSVWLYLEEMYVQGCILMVGAVIFPFTMKATPSFQRLF